MTNFDMFLVEANFAFFAKVAVHAEKILHINPVACELDYQQSKVFTVSA